MVHDYQVRKLMKLINQGEPISAAAAKSGMSEPTARKYSRSGLLPSHSSSPRTYRTRADPFEAVWPQIEPFLRHDPSIEAVTLFDYLCRRHPGLFAESQIRTLQRRIKVWKALNGPQREVFFPQLHLPARQSQSDFTSMNDLAITVCGQPFDHLLYHFTLTYSNWESVTVCFSESFEALSSGLQNALWQLGAVPEEHRTDSLSAAVAPIQSQEEFTARYKGLLDYYCLKASHSSPSCPNENGDVEQSHHRFKRAVAQELILRSSRDFSSRPDYEDFLRRLVERRNQLRKDKLREELLLMRPLPSGRTIDYTPEQHRVSRNSTVIVRNNVYSVPSQLIGEKVEVRLFAEELEIFYAGRFLLKLARARGGGNHSINYRHVIHSLVRKPGAMANYKYREGLFPRLMFRVAYDLLTEQQGAKGDKQYLKILELAAQGSEEKVELALRAIIEQGEEMSYEKVEQIVAQEERELCVFNSGRVDEVRLSDYDLLLSDKEEKWAK